jgi:hypothetical protein
VTSLAKLLGHALEMELVIGRVVGHFGNVFGLAMEVSQESGVRG